MATALARTALSPSSSRTDDYRVGELTDVVSQLRQDFADRDALYRDLEALLYGEIPVSIPDAYRKTAVEVRNPLAVHIINTVTAALSVNPFTLHFEPTGFGDSHQENATLREHFFEASWRRQEQEAGRRLFRLFLHSLSLKGEAILKTVERSKRVWAPYTQYSAKTLAALEEDGYLDRDSRDRLYDRKTEAFKRLLPYPIATTDVLPETFYYQKGEDGFTLCAEVKELPYLDALDRYHATLDSKGRVVKVPEGVDPSAVGLARSEWSGAMSSLRTLKMVEVWDWAECGYMLVGPGQHLSQAGKLPRGTLVKRVRHGYGDPFLKTLRGPYFHALGITTASRLPHRAGLGVLYGFLDLFPLLDSLLTIKGNAAFAFGFPTYKENAPTGSAAASVRQASAAQRGLDGTEQESERVRVNPGDVLPWDISPIDAPRTGLALEAMVAEVRGFLELALPSVVSGVISGDESGYALNQAAHLARLAWDPIVDNAQVALGDRTGFESWLIERKIAETVYVWGEPPKRGKRSANAGWLAIGPDDLAGVHRYRARLEPETPSNRVIEARLHESLLKLRLEAPETAVEEMGSNPDEVERAWLLHDLKQDPQIQERLKRRVFDKLGTIDQAALRGGPGEADVVAAEQARLAAAGGGTPQDAIGQVFQPGQNGMPLVPPTPGGAMGVPPGVVPGVQGPPANAIAQPGQ
ncbi:MAG: hypothetical protein NUW22_13760 [Acidobacteria bacterium]|nr:hypothetical protein [Acidobacteriota bacterium]